MRTEGPGSGSDTGTTAMRSRSAAFKNRPDIHPLLVRAAAGDDEAIGALYLPLIDHYKWYVRQRAGIKGSEAEDIASEAFACLLEEFRTGTVDVDDQHWSLCYHPLTLLYKRRNRLNQGEEVELDGALEFGAAAVASATQPVDDWEEVEAAARQRDEAAARDEERLAALRNIIEQARPYRRFYLTLRWLDGLTVREIAKRTGERHKVVARRVRKYTEALYEVRHRKPHTSANRRVRGAL